MALTSKKYLVIGATSLALEVAEVLKSQNFQVVNYEFPREQNIQDFLAFYYSSCFDGIFMGIYSRRIALPILQKFKSVHKSEIFSCLNASAEDLSNINSAGTYISFGSIISLNVTIGEFCYVGLSASIGHDVIIEDYVIIMPGARISGNAHICSGSVIGSNAVIHQGRKVQKNTYIKPCEYY